MDKTHPLHGKGRRAFDEHKEDDASWFDGVQESLTPMLQPARCDYASTDSPAYKKHKNAVRAYRQGRISREKRDQLITAALNEREAEARAAHAAGLAALSQPLPPETALGALRAAGLVAEEPAAP